jgi:hypothetical protein
MDNLTLDQKEAIAKAVVDLIQSRGVRTYHTLIEILMTTIILMMRRMPTGNEREQTRKSLIEALQNI